jgi:hypothetical protein
MVLSADSQWSLPPDDQPTLVLSRGELLLVDWIICGASRLLLDQSLDALTSDWKSERLAIWAALAHESESFVYQLDRTPAFILLAACPTTFRWGVGDDVGYSLKMKLAKYLAPDRFAPALEAPADVEVSSDNQDKAPDHTDN